MVTVERSPSDGPSTVLVSVVIPTRNAGPSLKECVDSVHAATTEPVEVIVVDSESTDGSLVGVEHRSRVIVADSSCTRARLIGARAARGQYVLNLDADQRLLPGTLERALGCHAEIVGLGETCVGPGLVAMANRWHNDRVQSDWSGNIAPISGSVIPRFYRRSRLLDALNRIPPEILDVRPSPYAEDSLVFWEASRDRPTVAFVPNALLHLEVSSVLRYSRKWFRYGTTAKAYRGTPYSFLLSGRARRRFREMAHPASLPAVLLRGPSFLLGYFL